MKGEVWLYSNNSEKIIYMYFSIEPFISDRLAWFYPLFEMATYKLFVDISIFLIQLVIFFISRRILSMSKWDGKFPRAAKIPLL